MFTINFGKQPTQFATQVTNKNGVVALVNANGTVAFLVGNENRGSIVFQSVEHFKQCDTAHGRQFVWQSAEEREKMFTTTSPTYNNQFPLINITIWPLFK